MAYDSDKKPAGLTPLTSLEADDTIIVGDTSDVNEVVKTITRTNLVSDLGADFATAAQGTLADSASQPGHTHTASDITDFDTEVSNNSAVTANTAKVSNATHTGDVTGSTALTIANEAVTLAKTSAAVQTSLGKADTALQNITSQSIDNLSDVDVDKAKTPADGDVLTFDGTDWNAETPAAGGDVSSTGNLTDNTIVRGDGGAKGVQDSSITLSDQDDIGGVHSIVFTPDASAPAHSEGQLYYDDGEKGLIFDNDEAEVRLTIGQENWIRVRNSTGSTINNLKAVYISGATGQLPNITLARADAAATARTIGLATHDIENNSNGFVTTFGVVRDVDTSAWTDGDTLYLDPTTAGELTTTKPDASVGDFPIVVGYVAYSHVSNGKILVHTHEPVDVTDVVDAQAKLAEGAFVDGDKTKLDGIETGADVTDATNVTAAGALMDSELTNVAAVKAINQGLATTSDVTFTDLQITGEFGADAEVDDGNSSTADTIDWTTGNFHKSTMTGNCTYTFTAPTYVGRYQLKLIQDATGSRTATWPAAVKWPGGTAPTLTTTANAEDIITFYWDGTSYYAVETLNFS